MTVLDLEIVALRVRAAELRDFAKLIETACDRREEGEPWTEIVEHNYGSGFMPCVKADFSGPANVYRLRPKRRPRPWTARDWAKKFHCEFLVDGERMMLTAIAQQLYNTVVAFNNQTIWRDAADQRITQLDGSPCGEWEPEA